MSFDDTIDQDLASKGEATFKQKCTACHMPARKLIGPAMSGIFKRRSPEWVMNMLLNPTEMLKQDPIAKALLKEYNNVMMLNQNLSEEEARAISEYLRTL
jgi:mono/diheme cytochrome c family protein